MGTEGWMTGKPNTDYARSNLFEVSLPSGRVEKFETPKNVIRKFLGGRGLNMHYLYNRLTPGTAPLSPENVLIIGTGLLTGSGIPNCSRFSVSALSPESRALGDANCGGFFGPELRFAGVDRLLITGRAEKLSYLYIEDGEIELRDATAFRGLDVIETQKKLGDQLGRDIQIACIGEAGEKMVRFAAVMNGLKNAAGRGGLGAVMGSKNLKAVVARGTGGVPVRHREEFVDTVKRINEHLHSSKVIHVLGRVGTPLLYEVSNFLGAIRTKNSQLNAFEDTLDAERIHEHVDKMVSCYNCMVHCRHRNRGGEGPEYTTVGLLGANLGIADAGHVIELNNLTNRLGLDVSSTGTIIGWAIELFEKGFLKASDFDMREPLRFGDFEAIHKLVIDISERKGLGDLLAESTHAVDELGEETRDFLIEVKGLPQSDPHDVRYIKSFALGIATASRGADHLRSRPTLDIFDLPEEIRQKIYGRHVSSDPTDYNTKEAMVYTHENIYSVIDSLGICKFICHGFNSPKLLGYSHFQELIRLVTGMELSLEELEESALRIVDLERTINNSLGLSIKDDTLPKRYFEEEMKLNLGKGHRIEKDKFDAMLSRYYDLRGWDGDGRVPAGRSKEITEEN